MNILCCVITEFYAACSHTLKKKKKRKIMCITKGIQKVYLALKTEMASFTCSRQHGYINYVHC